MKYHIRPDGTFSPGVDLEQIQDMSFPVLCRCGGIYDVGAVTVLQRYADCSVWKTPCCKVTTDDRGPGWSSGPTYECLDRETGEVLKERRW